MTRKNVDVGDVMSALVLLRLDSTECFGYVEQFLCVVGSDPSIK